LFLRTIKHSNFILFKVYSSILVEKGKIFGWTRVLHLENAPPHKMLSLKQSLIKIITVTTAIILDQFGQITAGTHVV
jgi:hypothetical protein